jgi:hypothetical protein
MQENDTNSHTRTRMDNSSETTSEPTFDDLRPERRISAKTAKILTYAPSILEARSRGVTWTQLASRLTEAGTSVKPDYLRAIMERYADSIPASAKGQRRALLPTLVTRATKPREKKVSTVVSTPPRQPTTSPATTPPVSKSPSEFVHAAERNANREA